jgi:hypothetical protein
MVWVMIFKQATLHWLSIHLPTPQQRIQCLDHDTGDCIAVFLGVFFGALSQPAG